MAYCTGCGTTLDAGWGFCPGCGSECARRESNSPQVVTVKPSREQVFFDDAKRGITVTTIRFIAPGRTYAMSGVTSVKLARKNGSRTPWVIFALVMAWAISLYSLGFAPIAVILAMAMMIVGPHLTRRYCVQLYTASGEAEDVFDRNRQFVEKVVGALNEALVARG